MNLEHTEAVQTCTTAPFIVYRTSVTETEINTNAPKNVF